MMVRCVNVLDRFLNCTIRYQVFRKTEPRRCSTCLMIGPLAGKSYIHSHFIWERMINVCGCVAKNRKSLWSYRYGRERDGCEFRGFTFNENDFLYFNWIPFVNGVGACGCITGMWVDCFSTLMCFQWFGFDECGWTMLVRNTRCRTSISILAGWLPLVQAMDRRAMTHKSVHPSPSGTFNKWIRCLTEPKQLSLK